ncbi:MAG: Rne/Rng family ribonuclease [Muribaculaceae bacterium]
MKSELIVDVQAGEFSIALLEDGRLVSLQKEARNIAYAVGDIYLAKVKKLMPGLNAAFVNVGYEKDAFLHYLDLGPHFATYSDFLTQLMADRKHVPQLPKMKILPDIDKHGSVAQTLTPGQELLVQIVKEPISSKGPRLTTEISFTGRYLVLTPFNDKISISQKIKSSEEKLRLRQLIEFIKPRNFGVIVRTSAEGKKSAELDSELKALLQCFEDACTKAQKSEAPALVFEEENRVVGMLRDVFSPSFESIYVNDADIYQQILKYVSIIAPDRKDIVKLYTKDTPIFDHFGITRQIKSSFGKTVSFKSGAYIIIEHTEALHVIDVNSGNRAKATNDQESNALEVNLRAADEIARQLRLRDMGGIIVVDFIDMAKPEHRQQLYDHMREIMANDRARHNILPLSKFGLMQITRQRVRPVLDIHVAEQCPSCLGKGEVQPSLLFTDTLREKLEYIVETLGIHDFVMYVHPYVDAYIKKGLFTSMYGKWRRALGRTFKILPDESLAYLQYRVVDKDRNELDLIDEKDSGESSKSKKDNKARKRGGDTDDTPATEQPQQQPKSQAKPEPKEQPKQQPKSQSKEQPKQQQQPKPKPQPKPQPKEQQPKAQVKEQPRPQPKPIAQPKDELPAEEPKELPTEERSALLLPEPTATPDLLDIVAEPEAEPDTDVADDTDGGDTEAKAKTRRRRRRKPRPKSDTTPQPEE